MAEREQKQKYLRQNVAEDQYQDFAEFCQNEAGQIDIDQWSFAYIKQLVRKFKTQQQREQNENQHERSFANYQTADIQQAYTILAAVNTSHHANNIKKQEQKKGNHQSQPKMPETSAVDLLDSVFQTQSNKSSSPEVQKQANYTTSKNYKSQNVAAFQNMDFWGSSTTSKNNNDFNNFWELSSDKKKGNQSNYKTQNVIKQQPKPKQEFPTYEDLAKNIDMQKKSSPYSQQKTQQKPQNMKKPNQIKPSQSLNNFNSNNISQTTNSKNMNSSSNVNIPSQNSVSQGPSSHHIKLKQMKSLKNNQVDIIHKMNKVAYDGPVVHKSQFCDKVPCFKASLRPQLSNFFSVVIQKHEIVERNFFVSDYAMYHLKIMPVGLVVRRNYEDFTKLRNALQQVYPGVQLPYLQKNSWFSETNIDFIKRQKAMLEFFLNDLIKNDQIRNSRMFQDFLTLKQHKAMKRKFQQYAKMDKLTGLQELCVLDGNIEIVISEKQRIHRQFLGKYVDTLDELLQRQRKAIQLLGQQYNQVQDTLTTLSKLSTQIAEQTKKTNMRVPDFQIPGMEVTFNMLCKSFQEWASRAHFQMNVVNKRLTPFFKYERQNLATLKNLIQMSNSFQKAYLKKITYQQIDTSVPYSSQKLKYFKSGVLQQSKNLFVLKYQTGYISNQVAKQSVRFFDQMSQNFKAKWLYQAEKYKERLSKDLQFYGNIVLQLAK